MPNFYAGRYYTEQQVLKEEKIRQLKVSLAYFSVGIVYMVYQINTK